MQILRPLSSKGERMKSILIGVIPVFWAGRAVPNDAEAAKAIPALDGKELESCNPKVNEGARASTATGSTATNLKR